MSTDSAAHDRARWNARYESGLGPRLPNPRLQSLRGQLRPGCILDIAGGVGANARLFPDCTVIVADISDAALAEAAAPRIWPVQADARHLPFAPESFDSILCLYFFEPGVNFSRLLRPGGTVFFETYTEADRRQRPAFNPAFLYDADRGRAMFAGMQIVAATDTDDGRRAYTTIIARRANS
ncbi:MAG: class I SAM-dependent methyltransferase [Chloroflexi bacterium]|nr:class I SAM-dependent methyltransferase [Chloroflexota bacterium]